MSTSREELPVLDPFEMLLDAARYAERIKPEWSRAAKRSVAQARLAATPKAAVDREVIARIIKHDLETGLSHANICHCTDCVAFKKADAILALLPSVLGGVDRPVWQPIETAPRDATEIIGLLRPKVIRLIWWFAPSSRSQGWRDENSNLVKPTHWMRLPDNAGLVSGGGK